MTNEQKEIIIRMQRSGKGYRTIATETGLPLNSVKSWFRRHTLTDQPQKECMQCGAALVQTPGKRARLFCSDQCRSLWWAAHPERRQHRVQYKHICQCCGKTFVNDRKSAKYCGRACFAKARIKVNANG